MVSAPIIPERAMWVDSVLIAARRHDYTPLLKHSAVG